MEPEQVSFLLGADAITPRQDRHELLMDVFLEEDMKIEKRSRQLVELNVKVGVPHGYACHLVSNLELVLNHNILVVGDFYGSFSKNEKIRFVLINMNDRSITLKREEKVASLGFFKMMPPNIVIFKLATT